MTIFGYLILISVYFNNCISLFSPWLFSIKKMYQTLETMFDHITKHLKVDQNYPALHHIFNSLFGVWKCIQTWSFMLDIFHRSSLRTDLFEISVWLLLVIIHFQQ